MDSKFTLNVPSRLGSLVLEIIEDKLVSLSIVGKPAKSCKRVNHAQADNIQLQLENYFSSAIPFSSVDLLPCGTAFQKAVWNELCKIPLGETRTYGEIAKKLNSSARAVGNACRKNPIAIVVPCHRVVAANGIGGYAGKTEGNQLKIKRWLLSHEGINL